MGVKKTGLLFQEARFKVRSLTSLFAFFSDFVDFGKRGGS